VRWAESDGIRKLITHSVADFPVQFRQIEITQQPEGCDNVVTWTQRLLYVDAYPPFNERATATLRDGRIASVVYVEAPAK
jgi:hypothetical protein